MSEQTRYTKAEIKTIIDFFVEEDIMLNFESIGQGRVLYSGEAVFYNAVFGRDKVKIEVHINLSRLPRTETLTKFEHIGLLTSFPCGIKVKNSNVSFKHVIE